MTAKAGRPFSYSEEEAQELVRLIGEEGKSLRKAAEALDMTYTTAWRAVNSEAITDQYARACVERGFVLAEETLDIADNPDLEPADKKVRIDTRKWFASKLDPKRLGDKIDLNHGGQTDNPVSVINLLPVKPKDE